MDLLSRPRAGLFVAAVLAVAALAACAHGGEGEASRPESERAGDAAGVGSIAAAERPVREISTDRAMASDAGAGTPARSASQRVVEEGKGYLIADQPREAAQRFERATRIDPTNGFAYYYLGRAREEAGDRSGAVGVLEKAEALLGPYPEWRERAARLAASLDGR